MNTLLIAEHNNETLADATVKAVTAAAQMGGECHVLVAGSRLRRCCRRGRQAWTVSPKCFWPMTRNMKNNWPSRWLRWLVTRMADGYATIATPASTNGKNFTPRIAALLGLQPNLGHYRRD